MKQTTAEARIIALDAQLRIFSQPENGDVQLEGETPETVWGGSVEILLGKLVATTKNPADS